MPKARRAPVRVLTADDVRYDDLTHTSWLPDGREVPHVTAVLQACGITADFEGMARFGKKMVDAIQAARDFGRVVHDYCHAYDDNDLDLSQTDERVMPSVEAWAQCRKDLGLVPVRRERRLFHPLHVYTGIEDGVFEAPVDNRIIRVLGDIKTGDPTDAGAHLQTAAYQAADEFTTGEKIDERWAIWLTPWNKVPYRIVNYTARPGAYQDYQKFLACLTVYREQPQRRIA